MNLVLSQILCLCYSDGFHDRDPSNFFRNLFRGNGFIINKKVDPFVHNVITVAFDKLFECRKSSFIKRTLSGNLTDSDFDEFSVLKNNLGFTFSFLVLSVNVNRLMFIGIEQDNQTEIIVKFRHCYDSTLCAAKIQSGRNLAIAVRQRKVHRYACLCHAILIYCPT